MVCLSYLTVLGVEIGHIVDILRKHCLDDSSCVLVEKLQSLCIIPITKGWVGARGPVLISFRSILNIQNTENPIFEISMC